VKHRFCSACGQPLQNQSNQQTSSYATAFVPTELPTKPKSKTLLWISIAAKDAVIVITNMMFLIVQHIQADEEAFYSDMQSISKNILDQAALIEDMTNEVQTLYNRYLEYYHMAIEPKGSLNSFNENRNKIAEEILETYRELKPLLNLYYG
jgi:hypothetical protein